LLDVQLVLVVVGDLRQAVHQCPLDVSVPITMTAARCRRSRADLLSPLAHERDIMSQSDDRKPLKG